MNRSGWALAAAAAIGAVALARLAVDPVPWGPPIVTALAGAGAAALVRHRLGRSWALVSGTAAVLLSALWTVVPSATRIGVPTPTTVRVVHGALVAARPALAGVHVPIAATPGVVLIGTLVAGVAGVATALLPGALALAPALTLVGWSTVALPTTGAAVLLLCVAGVGAVLLVAPGPMPRSGGLIATTALVLGALCIIIVTATATAGAGGSGGAGGQPVVAPTALNLVADLSGIQVHDPDLVLFSARTGVPTYWQVAALTEFESGTWAPDAATVAALTGTAGPTAPSSTVATPAASLFTATVTVASFSSRLLPVPPGTVGLRGLATITPVGVIVPEQSAPGLRYVATAPVPRAAPSGAAVQPGEALVDTVLPPQPPVIGTLARQVTAVARSPLDKAEALTDWFRSGRFRYSLTAKSGSLVDFLTTTRVGSCQQFAGAFALLARAAGLSARVAVGFTTGERKTTGTTVVRGIDAHAWPQVDINGSWVSFEPTPERPAGELSPSGVLGPAGIGLPNPNGPPPNPRGLHLPHPPVTTVPVTGGEEPGAWLLYLAAPVVVVSGALGWLWWRRRRERRRRSPRTGVERSWALVDRALARRGMARPSWRTPTAHARALRKVAAPGSPADAVAGDLELVARLQQAAAFSPDPVSPVDAEQARSAAERAVRGLRALSGG